MTGEFRELSEADDVFERFIRTLCEYDISQETAGALTLQLFGGVKHTDRGRRLRGNIHAGVLAGEHTNIPGLVTHLVDLAPGARKVNGSNSTYTGLTGPLRSVGPDSGWYLNEGVLTDSTTQYLAVQNPDALAEKSIDCFVEVAGSSGVTISKKGFHETVPVNASLLFIGNPVYGGWDEYSPLNEQLGAIDPSLASQLDLLYVDIDGCEDRPDVPYVNPDAASEYIQHARETCAEFALYSVITVRVDGTSPERKFESVEILSVELVVRVVVRTVDVVGAFVVLSTVVVSLFGPPVVCKSDFSCTSGSCGA